MSLNAAAVTLAPAAVTLAPAAPQGAINHHALAATHYHADCDMTSYGRERAATLAPIAAAHNAGGPESVLQAARGSNHTDIRHAWALAMTAVYGPVGTHPSQTEHPDVIRAKGEAADKLRRFLAV